MIKVMVGLRRRSDLTREQFQRYWFDQHPHAAGDDFAGIKAMRALRYVQMHAVHETINARLARARQSEPDFDGFAELWFEDLDTFLSAAGSDDARVAARAYLEDERNFVDWSRTMVMVAEEHERYRSDRYLP